MSQQNASDRIDAMLAAQMKPVRFQRLVESLGQQHFDLEKARGEVLPEGGRMFRFPEPGYTPRRVGWDCYHNALQTRGCEAERIDDHENLWAMTRICRLHDGGEAIDYALRLLSTHDRETILEALRLSKAVADPRWRPRFEELEKRLRF